TFRRIWSNLQQMKSVQDPFLVILRLHYTLETYKDLARFGRTVREEFGDDKRFTVLFKAVERLGGPNDRNISKMGSDRRREIESYMLEQSGVTNTNDVP